MREAPAHGLCTALGYTSDMPLLTMATLTTTYHLLPTTYELRSAHLRMSSMSSAVLVRIEANSVMRMLQKKLNWVVSRSCTHSSFRTTWWPAVGGVRRVVSYSHGKPSSTTRTWSE